MKTKFTTFLIVLAALVLIPVSASAGVIFLGSQGSLAAEADFEISGGNLVVTLTNTSTADVRVPADVLTAVFFSTNGGTLTPLSALVAPGSTVLFGSTDPGGVVGGEWAYATGLSGAPNGATRGISSSGLGLFGPHDLFPGHNLQGPASPGGIQYGITSAGDNPSTGNGGLSGNALIMNSVVFTLSGLPQDFDLGSISKVSFQYGTALGDPDEPNVPGVKKNLPEPMLLLQLGFGLAGMGLVRRRFFA